MTEARGGWFWYLFGRRAPERTTDGRHIRRIIEAYGACLPKTARERPHRPERDLPYSKEEIGRAILVALRYATTRETTEPLRQGFADLERFLSDEEWRLVDEYERLVAVGGLAGGMSDERHAAAVDLLAEVEARRGRRFELLAILDREAKPDGDQPSNR